MAEMVPYFEWSTPILTAQPASELAAAQNGGLIPHVYITESPQAGLDIDIRAAHAETLAADTPNLNHLSMVRVQEPREEYIDLIGVYDQSEGIMLDEPVVTALNGLWRSLRIDATYLPIIGSRTPGEQLIGSARVAHGELALPDNSTEPAQFIVSHTALVVASLRAAVSRARSSSFAKQARPHGYKGHGNPS